LLPFSFYLSPPFPFLISSSLHSISSFLLYFFILFYCSFNYFLSILPSWRSSVIDVYVFTSITQQKSLI
jgi:hypothetical protein